MKGRNPRSRCPCRVQLDNNDLHITRQILRDIGLAEAKSSLIDEVLENRWRDSSDKIKGGFVRLKTEFRGR